MLNRRKILTMTSDTCLCYIYTYHLFIFDDKCTDVTLLSVFFSPLRPDVQGLNITNVCVILELENELKDIRSTSDLFEN
jgi:hypothetical protein